MDPFSHVVAGRAVVALFDNRVRGRGVAAAAIVGALCPDADIILAPAGWDIYLRAHQAGTHSIVGGLLVACVAAMIVRALTRRSFYLALAAASGAGAMSHLWLDVISGARIRLAWPLADGRVAFPLVAMGDPWLIAIFLVGLLAVWPGRQRFRMVAPVMLATVVAFLGLKAARFDHAARTVDLNGASPRAAEVRWGSLTEWDIYDRTPTAVRGWRISSKGEPSSLRLLQPLLPESPLVAASRSLATVDNFLRAHEFGFAIEAPERDGRTTVRWSDLRYCWQSVEPGGAIQCALWFGGVFAADGRPLTQEVTVGSRKQTRPAPR